ncbi:hypothetical protein B0H13DRAFT_2345131 [Mycena leptocephala]|nr:hypothetical protein B0H13DRAFT_2345131 [Mycena leptocephala]
MSPLAVSLPSPNGSANPQTDTDGRTPLAVSLPSPDGSANPQTDTDGRTPLAVSLPSLDGSANPQTETAGRTPLAVSLPCPDGSANPQTDTDGRTPLAVSLPSSDGSANPQTDTDGRTKSTSRRSKLSSTFSWLLSNRILGILSTALHLALVAVHVVLYEFSRRGVDHRLVFALNSQTVVSFAITAITTSFGTVYYAALVFITQTLSTRRDLQTNQPLTSTHDHASAWTGITAAFLRIWDQREVAAPILGVLHIFLYLANILILHITTPALFSLQPFNSSVPTVVDTQGFPIFNFTSFEDTTLDEIWNIVEDAILESLYFLPYIIRSTTNLGLLNGTVYDVPLTRAATGTFNVSATGFDVSCGYLTATNVTSLDDHTWLMSVQGSTEVYKVAFNLTALGPISFGPISSCPGFLNFSSNPAQQTAGLDLIFATFASMPDSSGTQPPIVPVQLNPIDSALTLFRCHLDLVNQTAVLDAQSLQVLSLEPTVVKSASTWEPFSWTPQAQLVLPDAEASEVDVPSVSLADIWETVYRMSPQSHTVASALGEQVDHLNEQVGHLNPLLNISLSLVENALSEVLAAMFWTLGHMPRVTDVFGNQSVVFGLEPGFATSVQISTRLRLNLNMIAIVCGLLSTVSLLLLSAKFSKYATPPADAHGTVDGTGFLHAIWSFRDNPMLQQQLEQVDEPSEQNLRKAGMIRSRLADRRNRVDAAGAQLGS